MVNKPGERPGRAKLLDTPEMYLGSRGDDSKDTSAPMWKIRNPGHGRTVWIKQTVFLYSGKTHPIL